MSEQPVISRYRDSRTNLRTQLQRTIRKAGVKAWPRLWQNLRASRATELAGDHPAHVAAAWLGHSTVVAQKHYWQVTDADFERAMKVVATVSSTLSENCANFVAPQRSTHSQNDNDHHADPASFCGESQVVVSKVTRSGAELDSLTANGISDLRRDANRGGAQTGAPGNQTTAIDPDLARVVAAWSTVSEATKVAILALVDGR